MRNDRTFFGGWLAGMSIPNRRRFQFSLRTLLIAVTLCAIPFGWLAVKFRQAERQAKAVSRIKELGGMVVYEPVAAEACLPSWLVNLSGTDVFAHVRAVRFADDGPTSERIESLKRLSQIRLLHISTRQVTEADVQTLKSLNGLQTVYVEVSGTGPFMLGRLQGLAPLSGLTKVEIWLEEAVTIFSYSGPDEVSWLDDGTLRSNLHLQGWCGQRMRFPARDPFN
jgi:hypothetical protein